MLIKRRTFLQSTSMATAALLVPKFLKALDEDKRFLNKNRGKILVVIQLDGGNDGLNTVIPVTNDIYYQQRPNIAVPSDKAHRLNTDASLHTSLPFFKTLYDNGELGIMNSVGYAQPDKSHFRSMDIWQSASESNQYFTTGWIGRYLDKKCKECESPTHALEIDHTLSFALKGYDQKGLAFEDPKNLHSSTAGNFYKSIDHAHEHGEHTVDYLYKTMRNTIQSASYIYEQSLVHPTSTTYPNSKLGKSLKTIASLIFSDINTSVYYASLGSFDTHANQEGQQAKLFKELNDALEAFVKDLKQERRFEDVMIMTFSEFGRRIKQNASRGTDHGEANNMFFISGGLKKKGLLNPMPKLTDIKQEDLPFEVDFKSVYATILRKWLQEDERIILGKSYDLHNFI